jgi:trehalose 6-phosphate synthase
MRITVRLIVTLVAVAGLVVSAFTYVQARQLRGQLERELVERAITVAGRLQDAGRSLQDARLADALIREAEALHGAGRFAGLILYDPEGRSVAASRVLPPAFASVRDVTHAMSMAPNRGRGSFFSTPEGRWYAHALPQRLNARELGTLLLVYDAGHIDTLYRGWWQQSLLTLLLLSAAITVATVLVVRWSVLQPMRRTIEWMTQFRMGEPVDRPSLPKEDFFRPLSRELTQMAQSLTAARAAAEEEARLRLSGQSRWTAERLKEHTRRVLQGRPMIVVSNSEPYVHQWKDQKISCMVPPSGLVTAVEPILRACGGTWVAQASGDADRETADRSGRLRVPPDAPAYTLRRVWLTPEQETGYYYGFANEGLWPLCHIAHTRPIFRAEDWAAYQTVNTLFAETVLGELEGTEEPCVLIQDYHFALLPRLIKERRPDAKIALFWHIPWPNPEAFAICPWAREVLHGMLGADLLGFHIQFHCNNFLNTVDRTLESRIEWERFAINRARHTTWVKPFPISIALQDPPSAPPAVPPREHVDKAVGMRPKWMAVGVDRVDYTKGIHERFRAVERLLERHPGYREQFTLVQIGAPSRTLIKRYHDLGEELEAEAARINARFQTRAWKPVVLRMTQHSHEDIVPFYQAADVCLVTSLHDGMNLVAKEFIASRHDEQGALILSRFTGAAQELHDALLVNPYDIDQVAEAIHYALMMDPEEQRSRMGRMRQYLQEHNVYRWAGNLVSELAQLRQATPGQPVSDALPRHEAAPPVV